MCVSHALSGPTNPSRAMETVSSAASIPTPLRLLLKACLLASHAPRTRRLQRRARLPTIAFASSATRAGLRARVRHARRAHTRHHPGTSSAYRVLLVQFWTTRQLPATIAKRAPSTRMLQRTRAHASIVQRIPRPSQRGADQQMTVSAILDTRAETARHARCV